MNSDELWCWVTRLRIMRSVVLYDVVEIDMGERLEKYPLRLETVGQKTSLIKQLKVAKLFFLKKLLIMELLGAYCVQFL